MGLFGPNIKKLVREGDIAGLIEVLRDVKQKDKWSLVAPALLEIGKPAEAALVTAVDAGRNGAECAGPAWALSLFGEPAVDPLLKAISCGPAESGFLECVSVALANVGEPAVDKVIGSVRRLEDPERRCYAVAALSRKSSGPVSWEALEELVRLSKDDPDSEVRSLAQDRVHDFDSSTVRKLEGALRQLCINLNLARFTWRLGMLSESSDREAEIDGLPNTDGLIQASSELRNVCAKLTDCHDVLGLTGEERTERCPLLFVAKEAYADYLSATTVHEVLLAAEKHVPESVSPRLLEAMNA